MGVVKCCSQCKIAPVVVRLSDRGLYNYSISANFSILVNGSEISSETCAFLRAAISLKNALFRLLNSQDERMGRDRKEEEEEEETMDVR